MTQNASRVRVVAGVALWLIGVFGPSVAGPVRASEPPPQFLLQPISGADGAFESLTIVGETMLRSLKTDDGFSPYLYFRLPEGARGASGAAYLEVTYRDVGVGRLSVEYDSRSPDTAYRTAEVGYGRFLGGDGRTRTAVFRLDAPSFRHRQNLGADLRVCSPSRQVQLHVIKATLAFAPTPLFIERDAKPWLAPYDGPTRQDVDAATLHHKVLCGYQGWFRCPGDPADQGWRHWSRDGTRIDAASVTFEVWPDMTELPTEGRYPAPGFADGDGRAATLFSSADAATVETHFRWMQQNGLDGVFAQRFLVNLDDTSFDRVLGHVRDSANRSGRVFAVCYDLTGARETSMVDRLVADWTRLNEHMQLARDKRYLHHDGKPVLFVWGFYPDRFGAVTANKLIDALKAHPTAPVTLIGGCPWSWRSERDPEWAKVYRRFDVISPWNVGNVSMSGGRKEASTGEWAADLAETRKRQIDYLPTIYPGFGWTNLKGKRAISETIPRLKGEFFWRQFSRSAELGVEMAYVAMFDELDEGTAILKVDDTPPVPGRFSTFEGMPPDWYLRLTGEGAKLIRGERANQAAVPISP